MPFDKTTGHPVPGQLSHDYTKDLIDPSGSGKRNYLEVKHKLPMLRDLWAEAQITTTLLHFTPVSHTEMRTVQKRNGGSFDKLFYVGGLAVVHATVTLPNGATGSGHKQETSEDFVDYLEKAETGSIGRALGAAGIGVEYSAQDYEYERDPENEKPYKGVVSPGTPIAPQTPKLTIGFDLPEVEQRRILMQHIADAGDSREKWIDLYKSVVYAAEITKEADPDTGEILPSTQAWRYEFIASAAPTLAVLDAIRNSAIAMSAMNDTVEKAITKRRKHLATDNPPTKTDGSVIDPNETP
jgi:hypothetical protein